jgi:hypothetical protein
MKVRILQDTIAEGRSLFQGTITELSDEEAKTLIKIGRAIKYVGKEADKEPEEVAEVKEAKDEQKSKK